MGTLMRMRSSNAGQVLAPVQIRTLDGQNPDYIGNLLHCYMSFSCGYTRKHKAPSFLLLTSVAIWYSFFADSLRLQFADKTAFLGYYGYCTGCICDYVGTSGIEDCCLCCQAPRAARGLIPEGFAAALRRFAGQRFLLKGFHGKVGALTLLSALRG